MNLDIDVVITLDGEQIPAPSGGGLFIDITKTALLDLIASDSVQNATYKVTGIDGFVAVYVNGFTPNRVSAEATGYGWVPSYTPSGDYKGQYHHSLGNVNGGEIYTWGEYNYRNPEGFPLVPDLPSFNMFDSLGRFTELPKSEANGYLLKSFYLSIDDTLTVYAIDYNGTNVISCSNILAEFYSYSVPIQLASLANLTFNNSNALYINCRLAQGTNGNRANDFAFISNCKFDNGGIFDNEFDLGVTVNNVYEDGGTINIQSNHFGVNGNDPTVGDVICNEGLLELQAFSIDHSSYISGVTKSGSGDAKIQDLFFYQGSKIENLDIDVSGAWAIRSCHWYQSSLVNQTYTDAFEMSFSLQDTAIDGGTNINYNKLNIYGGVGRFKVRVDFDANPLTGDRLLNLIPSGSVITRAAYIAYSLGGSGVFSIGMSVDDETCILSPTAPAFVTSASINLISAQALADRRLLLRATAGSVTSGTIDIVVEFTTSTL